MEDPALPPPSKPPWPSSILTWLDLLGEHLLQCLEANSHHFLSALVWMLMDFRLERKWSVVGFCTGAIAGLVAITPAAGFVGAPVSSSSQFVDTQLRQLLRLPVLSVSCRLLFATCVLE
jgi:hypothetical protein